MTYRLIILDIDGTIVGPGLRLSDRLKQAVAAAQAAGATVTLATGRMLRSARRFASELETNGPVICYQGALTADSGTGAYLRHVRLDAGTALDLITRLDGGRPEASPRQINVFVNDEIYARALDDWAVGYQQRMGLETHIVPSLVPLARAGPTLVLAVDEPDRTARLVARLRSELSGRVRVTHSLPHFCELASAAAGKAAAVEALAASMGVARAETVAFGDGAGDAEMLEWAGLGIAVASGHPETLAAADRTVAPPAEDGVAAMLEELLEANRIGG